jgi:hypothetical protein
MVKEMITQKDWMIHAKATRDMAKRALNYGDTQAATAFFAAARRMELIAKQGGVLAAEPSLETS